MRSRRAPVLTTRKGCVGGLSGTTAEHLKVGLESPVVCGLMGEVACQFVRARMPAKSGSGASSREDPLQKPDGGVRGFTEERPTHACPCRAGTEFLTHIVHTLTSENSEHHFVRGWYWCHQLLETERRSSASIIIHLGKEAQELELRCRRVQHVLSLASTLHCTACCCCDVSVSHYLCPSVVAGVAVHSILVVTTEQGFWEGRKPLRQGSVAREVRGSRQLRVVGDRVRRCSRASRFSRRYCQCKCGRSHRVAGVAQCFQGVGNHERRGSDFVVQSEWFPRRPGREPHFSQSPGTHFVRSQRERRARCSVGVSLRGVHIASRTPDWNDPTFVGSTGEHPSASSPRPAEPTRRQLVEFGPG